MGIRSVERVGVLLLLGAIVIAGLAACGGGSDDGGDDGLPSDPREAIALMLADFATIEREVPAVRETQGDVSNVDLGAALTESMAICRRAETMGDDEPANALRRACTRYLYGGAIRSIASGNADFLLDGIDQAKTILADYQ